MKKRWLALAAVVAFVGYQGWSYNQSLGIPPQENADGTIDYTLVDKKANVNGISAKPVRKEWVLRFPKDAYIFRPETTDIGRFEINGVSLGTSSSPNQSLLFPLHKDGIKFLGEEGLELTNDVFHVSLNSKFLEYGVVDERPGHGSYAYSHFISNDLRCVKEKELAPGVFKMRQATKEEVRRVIDQVSATWKGSPLDPELDRECSRSESTMRIALYSANGIPVGQGHCPREEEVKTYSCIIRIWLPQNRMGSLRFMPGLVPNLQEMYSRTVNIVTAATVSK